MQLVTREGRAGTTGMSEQENGVIMVQRKRTEDVKNDAASDLMQSNFKQTDRQARFSPSTLFTED